MGQFAVPARGGGLASDLIRDAVAATRAVWGDPPPLGMVTFINTAKVRRKRDPGRCYLRAGFRRVGETAGGLIALQLLPGDFPAASAPLGQQAELLLTPALESPVGRRLIRDETVAQHPA